MYNETPSEPKEQKIVDNPYKKRNNPFARDKDEEEDIKEEKNKIIINNKNEDEDKKFFNQKPQDEDEKEKKFYNQTPGKEDNNNIINKNNPYKSSEDKKYFNIIFDIL